MYAVWLQVRLHQEKGPYCLPADSNSQLRLLLLVLAQGCSAGASWHISTSEPTQPLQTSGSISSRYTLATARSLHLTRSSSSWLISSSCFSDFSSSFRSNSFKWSVSCPIGCDLQFPVESVRTETGGGGNRHAVVCADGLPVFSSVKRKTTWTWSFPVLRLLNYTLECKVHAEFETENETVGVAWWGVTLVDCVVLCPAASLPALRPLFL